MVQYIPKDALVAEIEERINKEIQSCATDSILGYSQGCVDSMRNVLSFLDTIEVKEVQEEPVSDDLEEAAKRYCVGSSFFDACMEKPAFKAGANWQKEQMKKLK